MKELFCAKCQALTQHKGRVDMNGEFVFDCQNVIEDVPCDRFIKLPADTDKETFKKFAIEHKNQNEGQVSLEKQEERLNILLEDDDTPAEEVAPQEAQPEQPASEPQ